MDYVAKVLKTMREIIYQQGMGPMIPDGSVQTIDTDCARLCGIKFLQCGDQVGYGVLFTSQTWIPWPHIHRLREVQGEGIQQDLQIEVAVDHSLKYKPKHHFFEDCRRLCCFKNFPDHDRYCAGHPTGKKHEWIHNACRCRFLYLIYKAASASNHPFRENNTGAISRQGTFQVS